MDHHNHPLNETTIIDYLIIGGGIAGLSALNRLVDLNKNPVLIESSDYPSHKVCGEFISHEAIPYLKNWGIISDCTIQNACIYSNSSKLDFVFPKSCLGLSRYVLDSKLANRAKKMGATIITNMRITELNKVDTFSEPVYAAKLSNGNTLFARHVFIGGGRFFSENQKAIKPKMPYFGFKAHFSGISIQNTLEMHIINQGYLGISPVEKDVVNIACLTKINEPVTNPEETIHQLLNSESAKRVKEKIDGGKMLFDKWLFTEAPEFEARSNPHLKNVYFIGDAAGTIAPATGNGIGMGITSGYMAADFAISQDSYHFKKAWNNRYAARIKRGNALHQVMMRPYLTNLAFFVCKNAPIALKMIFSSTREN